MKSSLYDIAYARSGDKGNDANIGVIAYNSEGYRFLKEFLTGDRVAGYFEDLGLKSVIRYELDNLEALNFLLIDALGGGGSVSLRLDSQGKTLGQRLLEMQLSLEKEEVKTMIRSLP